MFNVNDFKIYPRKNGYEVEIYDMNLFFENDPFYEFCTPIPGYFLEYKLKKGDVIIDAGAHLGTFAIIAAKLVGENGKVFAFEPDKKNSEEFQRNIDRNKTKNIMIIQKALWSEERELRFIDTGDRGILMESKSIFDEQRTAPVIATSIDDFVKEQYLDCVDFIKMDIEGAEMEVLKGAINTLMEYDVNLAIASYHEVDGKKISGEIENLLRKCGYEAKTTYPMHLTTYGKKK
jgi:FkbM family methyltransferase